MDESGIKKVVAEEIKDSRGNPTIKVTVWAGGASGSFSVPSGASTGIHEAHELRDDDGKGVQKAIEKVNGAIAGALSGRNVFNQSEIDQILIELDGTPNKNNLGGNSMIGASIACAKAAAKLKNIELFEYLRTLADIKLSRKVPHLFINLLEGGKHASNILAFQEYHIVPDTDNITEAISMGINIQNSLKEILLKDLGADSVVFGDEGGFALKVKDIRQPLFYLREAIKQSELEGKIHLALDVAATSFYQNGMYKIDGKNMSGEELLNIYKSLIQEFNLLSIEDPFYEEDFIGFKRLKEDNKILIVGDDLTVSNKILLKKALENSSINAMIIKPNQIGTLTETLETMKLARENNIELIVSHRGEETDDDFVADLAFAFGCFGLKSGAPTKPERVVKYRRLEKIVSLL
ncbi:MAG TPA: phosphopyruvate hydratase [Candidatus Paceibacterota bacterium]